jgi:superfamily II DNA or RNA helicase
MGDLYPDVNDPTFNIKLARHKEFNEQSIHVPMKDVEEESEKKCFASFELSPHQQFVKNFLSLNTPYNSLLLFHGLGTGKTCSAIGVSEEMRNYMKQMGITKKIMVVASPNVQENFKQQLFDERKMKKIGDVWSIHGCSGHKFLAEINPINLKGLSREKIIKQVVRIIDSYYLFMGYGEFANWIDKLSNVSDDKTDIQKEQIKGQRLRNTFENRLIIIDEVHNIRSSDNKKEKRVAGKLDELIKYVHPLRLLLLSATPMYNDPKEINWLLNLMNKNDGRSITDSREIFDKHGNFNISPDGSETGKKLLMRKATGYVSFVKGDNPYTFPYRIFPHDYKSVASLKKHTYPDKTILGAKIFQRMEHLDLFCIDMGSDQLKIYTHIINTIKSKTDATKLASENMERFGYTILQKPLEALNMTYPIGEGLLKDMSVNSLVGIEGLARVMSFKKNKTAYEYKPEIEEKYGRIFSKKLLGKYSAKLKAITDAIMDSEGICMVYSQYLDGGVVPLALALEELGCHRFDGPNLLKTPSTKKPRQRIIYTMITGNEDLSPNNALAVKKASSDENKEGDIIKVIIISKAGSEGLDFANIRQVHILDPWYNTNRIEQTIGRAVRNCSHKGLPFEKRNVMIFMYATLLKNRHEAADMYVYRVAELKAILIGNVSRALKEGAIDCLLNQEQMKSDVKVFGQHKRLLLSNGQKIEYDIGDRPFSQQCDYMESCSYSCNPTAKLTPSDMTMDTYFIPGNESLLIKIKELFLEHYFYKKDDIIKMITYHKSYSIEQINAVLDRIINDTTELIEDRYGRAGKLINIGEYYIFQPLELDNPHVSLFSRDRPLEYKHEKVVLEVQSSSSSSSKGKSGEEDITADKILSILEDDYQNAFKLGEPVKKSEKDWYKTATVSIKRLHDVGMNLDLLRMFIIAHIWDVTQNTDKLTILNHLYSTPIGDHTPFETELYNSIQKRLLIHGKNKGIFFQDGKLATLYVLDGDIWKKGEKTDISEFNPVLIKIIADKIKRIHDIYGFILPHKDTNELVFKTKIKAEKRQKGARCDQASKSSSVAFLNRILNDVNRNEGCPAQEFDEDIVKGTSKIELCCYTELILRCYNHHNVKGKYWFIEPEYSQYVLNELM